MNKLNKPLSIRGTLRDMIMVLLILNLWLAKITLTLLVVMSLKIFTWLKLDSRVVRLTLVELRALKMELNRFSNKLQMAVWAE